MNIRELRTKARLSQTQLAAVIGTSAMTISRWERGESVPVLSGQVLERLDTLVGELASITAPENNARFLVTPHPAMRNHPPADLLRSGFAFQALMEQVAKAKAGEFS